MSCFGARKAFRARLFSALVSAAVCASLAAQQPRESEPGQPLLLTGGRIIDGTGRAPRENMQVLIVGGRIDRIAPAGSFSAPGGARLVDVSGKTLLPGFVDLHFHMADDLTLVPSFVARGVTSARDPGAWMELFEPLRKWQAEHGVPAPRLFLCGPHLDGPGPAYPTDSVVIRSPSEARLAVRRQVEQGATAIKVYFRLPLDSIRAAADQARDMGVPVTAHLEIVDPRDAVEAGVGGIEHITSLGIALIEPMAAERYRQAILLDNNARREGRYKMWATIDPRSERALELARFLAERKVFVDPNLAVFERQAGDDQPNIEVKVRAFEHMVEYVGVLHHAGVPIVVGSHSNAPHAPRGFAFHREMELLVEAGMTPMEVLVAATRTGARFLRREDDLGTIEEGKLADLLIVDGDPLGDIREARNIETVIVGGLMLDPAEIVKPPPPNRKPAASAGGRL